MQALVKVPQCQQDESGTLLGTSPARVTMVGVQLENCGQGYPLFRSRCSPVPLELMPDSPGKYAQAC